MNKRVDDFQLFSADMYAGARAEERIELDNYQKAYEALKQSKKAVKNQEFVVAALRSCEMRMSGLYEIALKAESVQFLHQIHRDMLRASLDIDNKLGEERRFLAEHRQLK